MEKSNPWRLYIISIVTGGLYSYYWLWNELEDVDADENGSNSIFHLLPGGGYLARVWNPHPRRVLAVAGVTMVVLLIVPPLLLLLGLPLLGLLAVGLYGSLTMFNDAYGTEITPSIGTLGWLVFPIGGATWLQRVYNRTTDEHETERPLEESSSRTLTLRVEDDQGNETTQHINVDAVTYFKRFRQDLKETVFLGAGMASLLATAVFGIVGAMLTPIIAFIGLAIGLLLFKFILDMLDALDTVQIGTLTDTFDLESASAAAIEREFIDATTELLSVEGNEQDRYRAYTYTYHLVPDNIVNIEHERGRIFPIQYVLYAIAILGGGLLIWQESYLLGGIIGLVFIGLGYVIGPLRLPDQLAVNFQSGDQMTFQMSHSDATAVLDKFGER